jgi:hypothetical protein
MPVIHVVPHVPCPTKILSGKRAFTRSQIRLKQECQKNRNQLIPTLLLYYTQKSLNVNIFLNKNNQRRDYSVTVHPPRPAGNELKLEALRPLLRLLINDDPLIIETDLTDEEKAIVKEGRKEYELHPESFTPLEAL